jgi:phosphate transport system permease protein
MSADFDAMDGGAAAGRRTAADRLLGPHRGNERRRAAVDVIMRVVTLAAAIVVIVPLVAIVGYVLVKGLPSLTIDFLTHASGNTESPGALNAILGSLQMVPVALLIGGSLGLLAGIYLAEYAGPRMAAGGTFLVDVLLGVPSILAGVLVYATLVTYWTGSSAIAGSVALAVIMFPIVIRATEEVLRLVPGSIREASLALGIAQWRTILSVVVPVARAGLLTGIMLAFARGFGETAPLLFTARGSEALNVGDFGSPMAALPLFVYQNSRLPDKDFVAQAWSAAIVLLAIVLAINVIVRGRSVGSRVE